VYRFLLTPRWLGGAALAAAAAVIMVMLGNWQHRRYEERSAINTRIDAADSTRAVPLTSVLPAPTAAGVAGDSPGKRLAWTKVTLSGRYDPAHEIQARGRTVNGDVGFEIVTPLVLADGTAVLVDRGWVPAPEGGASAAPTVPPPPAGEVTVVGQIHLSESRPAPIERRNGRLDTRRIAVPRLAHEMPYPVYGAYVLLTEQTPTADAAFTRVPIPHENAWQNAGYTGQWWLFAAMALFAYGWQARKEAQLRAGRAPADTPDRAAAANRKWAASRASAGDRVEEADRKRAATQLTAADDDEPLDRVQAADRRPATARPAPDDEPTDRVEATNHKPATTQLTAADKPGDRGQAANHRHTATHPAPDDQPTDRLEATGHKRTATRLAADDNRTG
jgi:cytochrome oxidase assembly protein ShyY1